MDEKEFIEGKHAVAEALRAERPIDRLFVLETGRDMGKLISSAKETGAVIIKCDRARLDHMSKTGAHQGVIASVAAFRYAEVDDIFALADLRGEPPFIIVCDGVQDEGNLGAIIRSCEVCGAHGVVIPKRRSAGLTPMTSRASAGAIEHIPVARVPGIPSFLRELRGRGVWVYGAAGEEENRDAFTVDFSGACALVLGGEEQGLHRLTREECDMLVKLPMRGKTGSLNVSCAAAVLLYQIARVRD